MSGDPDDLSFARDGIVVDQALVDLLGEALARGVDGADQMRRLLAGEEVAATTIERLGPTTAVRVTFVATGAAELEGFVLLRCGALQVLVSPLDDGEVAMLEARGHHVRGGAVRSVSDYVDERGGETWIRLRNVLVRAQ